MELFLVEPTLSVRILRVQFQLEHRARSRVPVRGLGARSINTSQLSGHARAIEQLRSGRF
eukprot:9235546-Alexandrium_andersonii.AAC.1